MKLSKLNFLIILFIILSFSAVLSISISKFNKDLYTKKIIELEKNYYEKNKILIKRELNRALASIRTLRDTTYDNIEILLIEKVNLLSTLFLNNKSKEINSLINKYKMELNLFKQNSNKSFYFIFQKDGTILHHGDDKNLIGKNIFEISKNNKQMTTLFKEAIILDEKFGEYKLHKNSLKEKESSSKFIYIKKYEESDIYIASEIYKKKVDHKIQELIFKDFMTNRFGDNGYGYFWIIDFDNYMKMHPVLPGIVGLNQGHLKTLSGENLMNKISVVATNGGGYLSYKWLHPVTLLEDEKISYVKVIDDWKLYIGTGFYTSDLKKILEKEKYILKKLYEKNLFNIFIIIIISMMIFLLIAKYISTRIEKVESENEEQFNLLEQYKLLLDKSSVVSKTDKRGIITYVNKKFEVVSGYSKNEILGKTHNLVKHPDTQKKLSLNLKSTILSGNIWKGIIKNKDKNGDVYYTSTTIIPIKNNDGKIVEYISSGVNVTELVENRSRLKNIFKTDSLTGIGNRVSMIDFITKKERGVLVLFNIDRFKEINDSYGYDIGDKVIKTLSKRLIRYFDNQKYYVYRVQADIFGLFTFIESKNIVKEKVNEFITEISKKTFRIDGNKFILSYTCGMASDTDNLLTYSDIALSEAKKKKIKIKEFDSSMNSIKEFKNNIEWVERLHNAIKDDRIIPHYQPIYNYKTNKIEKYEALMRLIENNETIYPNKYLSIAKKTKLYPELTYKMVEKVFNKFAQNNFEFSINLSIEDLMNKELMIFIYDYAEQKGLFNRLVLEIVESEEIEDSEQVSKLISTFKEKGTKIAIDDFGSGYSNYEYLISLQADYLKIDGSIIKLILTDERTLAVVKSILDFAQKSDIKVIAEFVSNENIDKILKEIGVDYAQGFYYGKPKATLV